MGFFLAQLAELLQANINGNINEEVLALCRFSFMFAVKGTGFAFTAGLPGTQSTLPYIKGTIFNLDGMSEHQYAKTIDKHALPHCEELFIST